jgi:glycosyltransferase involved in cell wall biosynthesis
MPLYLGWLCLSVAYRRVAAGSRRVTLVTTRISGDSALLARLSPSLRLPVVIFLTGGLVGGSEFSLQRRPWVKRWIARGSQGAVAHATTFLDELKEAGFIGVSAQIGTIVEERSTPTDCLEDLPRKPGSPTLIWCGRNHPVKNMPALFRLFKGSLKSLGSPSLLVVADEPPRVVPVDVEVHVKCASPGTHMAKADVLLLTSAFEGQGAVIAEAALEGTPTVAYAVGGIPEMMERLDGGETVGPGAADTEFAEAVGRVWRRFMSPAQRQALAQRAFEQFERDPPEAWMRLLARLLRPGGLQA